MIKTVIIAEVLSKSYMIGHQQKESYSTLRDVLTNLPMHLWSRLRNPQYHTHENIEEFWALKDVNFEIKQGDRVGIIGRNGAGKSTLLKILSRITEPTTGKVKIAGRVASLLEVGTGFHPELTGRENIFLNGAILGMSRKDIKNKFDEIVAFAEVEKFLDTPVKRYSSGMYVRLAFAVAAHLEPEILIVDEVLAVGDAQFQKKCLGKMKDIGTEGRTVIFVSHNLNAIEQLCTGVLLLDKGVLKYNSENIQDIINKYLFVTDNDKSSQWINEGGEHENPWFMPLRFFISDKNGNKQTMPVTNNSGMWVQIEGDIEVIEPSLQIGYAIYNEEGILLYWSCHTDIQEKKWPILKKGRNIFRSQIPIRLLNEGSYRVELIAALYFKQWLCQPSKGAPFIHLTIQGGLSDSPYWMIKRPGLLAPLLRWDSETNIT